MPASQGGQSGSGNPVRVQHQQDFDSVSAQTKPRPSIARNVLLAFAVGGAICTAGQAIGNLLLSFGLSQSSAGARTAVILIFLGALSTGLGFYDELGRWGGAGSAIPITGFANTVVAPAMEFAREGYVLGMAAQLFTVAGPVIVYGLASAVLSAALRYALGL